MSYCRWSSDDFQCDVYVYEDSRGGWTTHVAGRRYVFAAPLPSPLEDDHGAPDWLARYAKRHRQVSALLDPDTMEDIALPHDGETFSDPTPGECADRLEELRALGYRVPQYAIDDLRSETE